MAGSNASGAFLVNRKLTDKHHYYNYGQECLSGKYSTRDSSDVFSISSIVRISMMSLPAFTLLFVTQQLEDMNLIFSL